MAGKTQRIIRTIAYWAFFILFVFYMYRNQSQISSVIHTTSRGVWYWVVLAIVFQALHFGLFSKCQNLTFRAMGIIREYKRSVTLVLSSMAVNVAAPSLNMAGVYMIVDEARRKGFNGAQALVAALLTTIFEGLIFLCIAFAVSTGLLINGELSKAFVVALTILSSIIGILIVLMFYFWRHPHQAEPALKFLGPNRSSKLAKMWHEAVDAKYDSKLLQQAIITNVPAHLAHLAALGCAMFAFGVSPFIGFLLPAVYVANILAVILSPTPMGIGFSEGIMVVAFTSQGIDVGTASAITLLYRGTSFWLPTLIGFILVSRSIGITSFLP